MDKFLGCLFVLLLLAFATFAAIDSCTKPEPMFYEAVQDAAVEAGEGEYYTDMFGYERFRWIKKQKPNKQ